MKVREFFFTDADANISNAYTVFNAWAIGANHGYAEACKDHQDVFDACQALYDHFLSRGGNPDSLLGIQVREALKKAKGE